MYCADTVLSVTWPVRKDSHEIGTNAHPLSHAYRPMEQCRLRPPIWRNLPRLLCSDIPHLRLADMGGGRNVTFNTIAMVVPRLSAIHAISTMCSALWSIRFNFLIIGLRGMNWCRHHLRRLPNVSHHSKGPPPCNAIHDAVLRRAYRCTSRPHASFVRVTSPADASSHNRTGVVTQPTHGPASPLFRAALTAQSSHSNSLVDPLPF